MRKDFGKKAIITPLPVLIIATYNEDGTANAMNAAWGGQREDDQITICLGTNHKTVENLKKRKAFTVSFGTRQTAVVSDFFGTLIGIAVKQILIIHFSQFITYCLMHFQLCFNISVYVKGI